MNIEQGDPNLEPPIPPVDEGLEPINPGHYTELLDRSNLVAELIENKLITHPLCDHHPDIRKKYQEAQVLILEAYQMVGELEPE